MEGLGTGESILRFKTHSISLSMIIKGLNTLKSPSVCYRHHRHLPLGGLQSPGAAWAGPVRHHLSLPSPPCNPLRITGHVHALQTICLRLHLLALNGTLPNKLPEWPVTHTKNGKREKKNYKKKKLSVLFHWILLLILQLTHNICSFDLTLTSSLDLHRHSKHCFLFFYCPTFFCFPLLLVSSQGQKLKLTQAKQPQIEFKW